MSKRSDHLPISLRGAYGEVLMPSLHFADTMRAWGSRYARLVLERCSRNKRQACEVLDISYHTLNRYLKYRPPERRCVETGIGAEAPAPLPAAAGEASSP